MSPTTSPTWERVGTPDEIRLALELFDRAFASGDADALAERFATDAKLLLVHSESIEGRPAILAHWKRLFDAYDPGAWRTEPSVTDVHGDRAYALATYSETLVPRAGGASLVVRGRLVLFLRRDPDGEWRVSIAMNSHSRPVERMEPDGHASPLDAGTMGS